MNGSLFAQANERGPLRQTAPTYSSEIINTIQTWNRLKQEWETRQRGGGLIFVM